MEKKYKETKITKEAEMLAKGKAPSAEKVVRREITTEIPETYGEQIVKTVQTVRTSKKSKERSKGLTEPRMTIETTLKNPVTGSIDKTTKVVEKSGRFINVDKMELSQLDTDSFMDEKKN